MLNSDKLVRKLKEMQGDRTAKEFAAQLGISGAYLSDIYNGKREAGPKILSKIGLKKRTVYDAA